MAVPGKGKGTQGRVQARGRIPAGSGGAPKGGPRGGRANPPLPSAVLPGSLTVRVLGSPPNLPTQPVSQHLRTDQHTPCQAEFTSPSVDHLRARLEQAYQDELAEIRCFLDGMGIPGGLVIQRIRWLASQWTTLKAHRCVSVLPIVPPPSTTSWWQRWLFGS